MKLVAVGA